MSAERIVRSYLRAKDENRPHLLASAFSEDAVLRVADASGGMGLPSSIAGSAAIEDALVRRFNQTYENIYTFAMERPSGRAEHFECDWLVGMSEKSSGRARVGCGRYRWTFSAAPIYQATGLEISIHCMLELPPSFSSDMFDWLLRFDYPWTSAEAVCSQPGPERLAAIVRYIGRQRRTASDTGSREGARGREKL